MLHFPGNPHMKDIQALLGINVVAPIASEPSYLIVASHESMLSAYDFQKLCSVLCAYRFFEIISLRAQCVSRIPISSPRVCMFLPGPASTKDSLDVSVRFWPDLASNHLLGIFPFARMAKASKNISEVSAKYKRWQFGVSFIPQSRVHINAYGCSKRCCYKIPRHRRKLPFSCYSCSCFEELSLC